MANLHASTRRADTLREDCLCVQDRGRGCSHQGDWHAHADDPCPVHTHVLVDQ